MVDPFLGEFAPAYLITFSTYGSWLHGDERGSVNRWRNRPGVDPVPANPGLRRAEERRLLSEPQRTTPHRRAVIERAIHERCTVAEWHLHALNVRTNHVHAVLSANSRPEPVMTSLKAWATRAMREARLLGESEKIWTRHGSTRYLWKQSDIDDACRYVIEGQGPDLPGSSPSRD
jgi:REP element-mobilizing transposase RayT